MKEWIWRGIFLLVFAAVPFCFAIVLCNPEPDETVFEAVYERHLWKVIVADLIFLAPFVWSFFDRDEEEDKKQEESGPIPLLWQRILLLMQYVNQALLIVLICVSAYYHELFVRFPMALVPLMFVFIYLYVRIVKVEE